MKHTKGKNAKSRNWSCESPMLSGKSRSSPKIYIFTISRT